MAEFATATYENPLAFFDSFLFHEGYQKLVNQFINDSELLGAFFNKRDMSLSYWETNEFGESVEFKEYFNSRLKTIIKSETLLAIKSIDDRLIPYLNVEINPGEVIKLLDSIDSYFIILSESGNNDINKTIKTHLEKLISYIKRRFHSLHIKHKVFRYLNRTRDFRFSFFGVRDEHRRFYKKLHLVFYENNIIPEDAEDDDEFVEVLASMNPVSTGIKIVIVAKKFEIALIFRALEPLFNNFNYKSIEESGCFVNKKNELITANQLSSALSDFHKKQRRLRSTIQIVLNEIEQYNTSLSIN
ncbi:MAG TPA: hypothetical protein DHV28_16475 [Ignavibacteriales bacterium]|nr:hypothetical protein [Ignavibacteriales bacterium]